MKARSMFLLYMLAALVLGCGISAIAHHYLYGYHYRVNDEVAYEADAGTVKLRHVLETRGEPILQAEKSVIVLEPPGALAIKLFEAEPMFKENFPNVSQIDVSNSVVSWTDGVRSYKLLIEPITKVKEPNSLSD